YPSLLLLGFVFTDADAGAHRLLVHIQPSAARIDHLHGLPSWTVSRGSLLVRESPSRARRRRRRRQFLVPPGPQVRLLCGLYSATEQNDLGPDTIHNHATLARAHFHQSL